MKKLLTTTTILTLGCAGLAFDSQGAAKKSSPAKASSAKSGTTTKAAPPKSKAEQAKPSREQVAAKKAAGTLTTTQKSKMLALVNEGSTDELLAIHGIGKSRAAALTKARPFESVDQLAGVRGVGSAVYSDLIAHAKSLTARRSPSSSKAGSGSSSKSKSSSKKSSSSRPYRPGPCTRQV